MILLMNIVRQLRLRAGLTQSELAARADTSQPTIAAYESGTKSPTLRTLERLAAATSVELVIRTVSAMTREDRRSIAWHRAVVRRLEENPDNTLALAKRNLDRWRAIGTSGEALLAHWSLWLELPVSDIVVLVLDGGPFAREMRQVSPFAGALSASERTQVLRQFQREEAA